MFRKSEKVNIDIKDTECVLSLPKDVRRIHAVQFNQSLHPECSYFCAEIVKLSKFDLVN